jgi:hypothetical protein
MSDNWPEKSVDEMNWSDNNTDFVSDDSITPDPDDKEEARINEAAQEALGLVENKNMDPTKAVAKVAHEEGLQHVQSMIHAVVQQELGDY